MVCKIDGNYKHIFRKNDILKIQNNFIFVDTETKTIQLDKDTKKLIFYFGFAYFWKRKEKYIESLPFYDVSAFWNKVEQQFDNEHTDILLYAHNCEFDFKILDGFNELFKRNWYLETFYIKNKTFMLIFKKDKYTLYLFDTTNYVNKKLKILGKAIGLKKYDIDFDKCTEKELIRYCKRDTRIIYKFIKYLINFLQENNLTKLKATSGSLAFNCFKHKFYFPNKKNYNSRNNIVIHNWKQVIRLERESYHGGITECFNLNPNLDSIKLDINSMYAYIMYKYRFPIKLLYYYHESNHSNNSLMNLYNQFKINPIITIIAKVSILIPKENAYILNDYGLGKVSFTYSENKPIKLTLCLPELLFLEQNNGKILKIHEIAIYKTKRIFKQFINFFHTKRVQYKKDNNEAFIEFCKIFMNTLYGKWSQKKIEYKVMEYNDDWICKNIDIIKCMIEKRKHELDNNICCYLGTLNRKYELYIINRQLYRLEATESNSFDSFVAISSLITSYARMLLIKYLKIAERKNVYYCDTDSLFCNKKGFENLKNNNLISEYDLGKLKVEGKGKCTIYAPKFYDFNGTRKAKGIKEASQLITENKERALYINEIWQKFKSDLKKGNLNEQLITISTKEIRKMYDKGKILSNNLIQPFSYQEILRIDSQK